jgi:hypothetical protein
MVKSYFLLYQNARKIYVEKKIVLDHITNDEVKNIYYFKVNDYDVQLILTQVPKTHMWLRHWNCGCTHYSLWQEKAECKHILAAELYLMHGGIYEKAKETQDDKTSTNTND